MIWISILCSQAGSLNKGSLTIPLVLFVGMLVLDFETLQRIWNTLLERISSTGITPIEHESLKFLTKARIARQYAIIVDRSFMTVLLI